MDEVKRRLPCFTGETEETSSINRGGGVFLRGGGELLRSLQPRLVFAGDCDTVETRWFGKRRLVIDCELRAGEPRLLQAAFGARDCGLCGTQLGSGSGAKQARQQRSDHGGHREEDARAGTRPEHPRAGSRAPGELPASQGVQRVDVARGNGRDLVWDHASTIATGQRRSPNRQLTGHSGPHRGPTVVHDLTQHRQRPFRGCRSRPGVGHDGGVIPGLAAATDRLVHTVDHLPDVEWAVESGCTGWTTRVPISGTRSTYDCNDANANVRPGDFLGHPKGLYVCFFTEMWERFSFYGMKALLLLYILKYHLFGDDAGYDLLGAYGGLVYAVPVIGGLLADRYLGMRKAVVFGGSRLTLPAATADFAVGDIIVAKETGAHIHIAHVSTKGAVEAVRRAKNEGINVTCEVTPHHFVLTDEAHRTRLVGEDGGGERCAPHAAPGEEVVLPGALAPCEGERHADDRGEVYAHDEQIDRVQPLSHQCLRTTLREPCRPALRAERRLGQRGIEGVRTGASVAAGAS